MTKFVNIAGLYVNTDHISYLQKTKGENDCVVSLWLDTASENYRRIIHSEPMSEAEADRLIDEIIEVD